MTDIKELRRLAEAATPGEWKPMYSARKSNPSEKDKFYSVSALSPAIPGWCDAKNIDIATVCKIYDGTDASNSAYIAAANPSAILSLLDHIEQQEAEIARLRKDAFRYRFLRDMMVFTNAGSEKVMRLRAKIPAPTHEFYSDWVGDKFDASVDKTIDASMADTSTQEVG